MEYNIAFGERLVQNLYAGEYEEAAERINNGDGDIVGYNTETDYIGELLEQAMGNTDYCTVSNEVLAIVNSHLEKEELWEVRTQGSKGDEYHVVATGFKTYEEAYKNLATSCVENLTNNTRFIESLGFERESILELMNFLCRGDNMTGFEYFLELHPELNINREYVQEQT